ncbi:MAG: ATP-binding protein [Pirellulales bacterium]
MRHFRDFPIRYKLTLLLMGVVGLVLLAVSVANVVNEVQTTRVTLAAKYSTLAKIVAAQSGAALSIADVDASAAQQIVSELDAEPSIRFAALYNAAGNEVVRHPADSPRDQRPSPANAPGATFTDDGFLDVVHEVKLNDGAPVGRIYLRASTEELRAQVRRTVLIASVVYLIALAIALLLSIALQRIISTPILELAQLTRRVSTEHDYSLSIERRGHDELGALCDGFNAMLAEIRRRDDELEQSNNELLRSNEELRQFAFVASHDLQEPLRSITSFCNLLEAEYRGRLDEQADNYIDRIVNGAKRMKALVTDLLGYSRVSREGPAPFQTVAFQEVVNDALANLQSSINESDAEIAVGRMPIVIGDRVQLIQLMQNLIGNAIKYRSHRPPRIRIDAEKTGDLWEFAVADNGLGIAPEHHHTVFEIFKRLHGREEYPGTGIGLAVCKKIVQRHGGQITLKSRPGAGSTFRFTIQTKLQNAPDEAELFSTAH